MLNKVKSRLLSGKKVLLLLSSAIFLSFQLNAQLSVSVITTDDCGTCNGTAIANATGGVPPYTYIWDDPNVQTTQIATGLCQGFYDVTVTDNNNDTDIGTGFVNPNPVWAMPGMWIDATCGCDGEASTFATGGTPPHTHTCGMTPLHKPTQQLPGFVQGITWLPLPITVAVLM